MRIAGTAVVLFGIAFVGITGLLTVGLWNLLLPSIFGLPAISFWQALGLLLLSRLLFGGLGGWGRRMRKARFSRVCIWKWACSGWFTPDDYSRSKKL